MKPIGVDIPIRRGNQGFFAQTFTTGEAIKSNLRNLLSTNNGERPINPSFGNNLNDLVFEGNDEIIKETIRDRIIDTVRRNIPSVIVNNITFTNNVDDNMINVSLTFSLQQYPNFVERLDLEIKTS